MTAGAGDDLHTYRSAVFTGGLPIEEGTSGCTPLVASHSKCVVSWKVARYESSCPWSGRLLQKDDTIPSKRSRKNDDLPGRAEDDLPGRDEDDDDLPFCKFTDDDYNKPVDPDEDEGDFIEDKDKDKFDGEGGKEEESNEDELDGDEDYTNDNGDEDINDNGDGVVDIIGNFDDIDPCANKPGHVQANFTIDTDWFSPLENSVYMIDKAAVDAGEDPVMLALPINSFRPETGYEFESCVPSDGCYEFYVFDTSMDGFQDGRGFRLEVDGQEMLGNLDSNPDGTYENYESFWGVEFGTGCSSTNEGVDGLTGNAIGMLGNLIKSIRSLFGEGSIPIPPLLSDENDKQDTTTDRTDVVESCTDNTRLVMLEYEADNWAYGENALYLFESDDTTTSVIDAGKTPITIDGDTLFYWAYEVGSFQDEHSYKMSACVDLSECNTFFFIDTAGNGIDSGFLTLTVNDEDVFEVVPGKDDGQATITDTGEQFYGISFGTCPRRP